MPNRTVPASAEGLPNYARRSAFTKLGLGLVAAAAFAPSAATQAAGMSAQLNQLMEAHRFREKEVVSAIERAAVAPKGSETKYAEAALSAALDSQDEALDALCAYRCASPTEELIRLRYIAEVDRRNIGTPFNEDLPRRIKVWFATIRGEV